MKIKYENIITGLMYLSVIIFGPIMPFICFILFRNDKFIKFHSLQSLLLSIVYLIIGTGIVIIYYYFIGIPAMNGERTIFPNSMVGLLDNIVYYFLIMWWALFIILCIIGAYKSSNGEMYEYPLIGKIINKTKTT